MAILGLGVNRLHKYWAHWARFLLPILNTDDHASRKAKFKTLLATNESLIARLQSENAKLETELAANEPSPLLDLPTELRFLIYEYCMVVGTLGLGRIYAPICHPRSSIDKPQLHLLKVNKQVRKEAVEVLLSRNIIILHGIPHHAQSFTLPASIPQLLGTFLTSLCLIFDTRNTLAQAHDALEHAAALRQYAEQTPPHYYLDTITERTHNSCEDLTDHWQYLLRVTTSPKLKHVQLDFSNCYCVLGCHRLVDQAVEYIGLLVGSPKLQEIVVLGTKQRSEREEITDELILKLLDDSNNHGRFDDGIRPKLCFRKFERNATALDQYDLEAGLEDEEVNLYDPVMQLREGGGI